MEVLQVVMFALTALFLILILKSQKSEITTLISVAAGITIFIFVIPQLAAVLGFVTDIASDVGVDIVYMSTIIKVLGIAFIATFCAELCRDAGVGTLASKVEFASKIIILSLSIPILMGVLQSILNIL